MEIPLKTDKIPKFRAIKIYLNHSQIKYSYKVDFLPCKVQVAKLRQGKIEKERINN